MWNRRGAHRLIEPRVLLFEREHLSHDELAVVLLSTQLRLQAVVLLSEELVRAVKAQRLVTRPVELLAERLRLLDPLKRAIVLF